MSHCATCICHLEGLDGIKRLLRAVAMRHGVTTEAMRSRSRSVELVRAREEFAYLAREDGWVWKAIAHQVRRHHATVINNCDNYEKRLMAQQNGRKPLSGSGATIRRTA